MENNKACCEGKIDKKDLIAKGTEYFKRYMLYKKEKRENKIDTISMVRATQNQIIQELRRDDLSREERNKLLESLEKITPDETGILAITKGTSLVKVSVCMIGTVLIAYFYSKGVRKD